MSKKAILGLLLIYLSPLATATDSYKALINAKYEISSDSITDPIDPIDPELNVIAEVIAPSDGSQISSNSTLIGGFNYNNRDFFSWSGVIAGHGALNDSMELIYDAGEGNVWFASSSDVTSISGIYQYTSNVYWYVSDNLVDWDLIASLPGYYSYNQPSQTMTFLDNKKRYLKIYHDTQPLNTHNLSYANYENLDLKIIKLD